MKSFILWAPVIGAALAVTLFVSAGCGGFNPAGENRALCVERQRSLRTALLLYANDNDDTFPLSGTWKTATGPYVGINLVNYICPQIEPLGGTNYGIAFNSHLAGINVNSIGAPSTYALIFDSTILTANAQSTTSTLPDPPRHGINVIMRLDGVAASVPPPN